MNAELQTPPMYIDEPSAPPIGVVDILNMLRRRLGVMLGVGLLVAAAAFAVLALQPRTYDALAVLMINAAQERVVEENQAFRESSTSSAAVDSEVEVLRSRRIAERVATNLKLIENPRWNGAQQQLGLMDRLRQLPQRFGVSPQGAAEPPTLEERQAAVVEAVADALSVRRRGVSFVIEVRARAGNPDDAAALANAVVDAYFAEVQEARLASAQRASAWLGQRLEQLRRDVQQRDAEVEAFRRSQGLVAADGRLFSEDQTGGAQQAVFAARADVAEKEARLAQVERLIRSGGSPDSIAGALNSLVIRDLRAREAELTARLSELENRYLEQHPSVQSVRAEIQTVQVQIRAEVLRIQTSLRNEVEIAQERLRSLERNLASARGELLENNSALVRLRELERDAEAARTVFNGFQQRFYEILDQGQLSGADARLVTVATPPKSPSAPNLQLALLLALAIGVGAGLAAALIAEATDDTLKNADAVQRRLGVRSVGSIPLLRPGAMRMLDPVDRHPAGYLLERPMSAFSEAIRMLRASVLFADLDRKTRIVAITSALPGEGKTTCALSLARAAAVAGQRVVLVDCDLRRRSLNTLLDIAPHRGILEVLTGEADWRSVVGRDEFSGCHVLPASEAPFTPQDVFGSQAMERLVQELKQEYGLVIFDCPPALLVADSRMLAQLADAVVVIARAGRTPIKALSAAIEDLGGASLPFVGVALNCVDPKAAGARRYSSSSYYKYAYREYYSH
jgi:capsular exopolysaccharide synthesis family protein